MPNSIKVRTARYTKMNTPCPNIQDLTCLCSMRPCPHQLVMFLTFYYVVLFTLSIRRELNIFGARETVIIRFPNDLKRNVVVMNWHRRRHLPLGRTRIPHITFSFFTMLQAIEE